MTDPSWVNRIRLMSPAVFFRPWLARMAGLLLLASALLCVWVGARAWQVLRAGAQQPPRGAIPATPWPEPAGWEGLDWTVLRGRAGTARAGEGDLAKRFRLAGTFFEFTAMGSDSRKAVIDDAVKDTQLLVSEQEHIDEILVARIQRDRVLLRDPQGRETELFLSFTGPDSTAATNGPPGPDAAGLPNRFGSRLGDNRWVFKRDALLRYYDELRDQPERLVLLFDSLKPVYTDDNRIQGYRLNVEGEREFFEAVGLTEGDIVQRVNNVDMTNRRRAEFFIRQFVENQATAFMLDVQRGVNTNRLTYEVR